MSDAYTRYVAVAKHEPGARALQKDGGARNRRALENVTARCCLAGVPAPHYEWNGRDARHRLDSPRLRAAA
jgi:hypothetical protein